MSTSTWLAATIGWAAGAGGMWAYFTWAGLIRDRIEYTAYLKAKGKIR